MNEAMQWSFYNNFNTKIFNSRMLDAAKFIFYYNFVFVFGAAIQSLSLFLSLSKVPLYSFKSIFLILTKELVKKI